jgi:hypothetical protein
VSSENALRARKADLMDQGTLMNGAETTEGSLRISWRRYRASLGGCAELRPDGADTSAADPALWGYDSGPIFKPVNNDAFRVHLAGGGDPAFVPPELANAVTIHRHLSYPDFFSLAGSVDGRSLLFALGSG